MYQRSAIPTAAGAAFRAVSMAAAATLLSPSHLHAALTTFVVDSTAQEEPPVANANCTLGEALRAANLDAPVDDCTSPSIGSGGPFVIELDDDTYTLTQEVSLSSGLPAVTKDTTINGHGATISRSSQVGTAEFRLFFVSFTGNLKINDATLSGGLVRGVDGAGSGADGGAIYNTGVLLLTRVTLVGNEAGGGSGVPASGDNPAGSGGDGRGGAIFNAGGGASLVNSTISANIARGGAGGPGSSTIGGNAGDGGDGFGAGVFNRNGPFTVRNTTIADNDAIAGSGGNVPGGSPNSPGTPGLFAGGAFYNFGENAQATAILLNTILADTTSGTDCENVAQGMGATGAMDGVTSLIESKGTCTFNSGTFLETDPGLLPLATNAPGLTDTHALTSGSAALDSAYAGAADGMPPHCEPEDQRGILRPMDGDGIDGPRCDIGAYELEEGSVGSACPDDIDNGCLGGFAKAMLLLKEDVATKEKLVAKLVGGPATIQTDMGNPLDASQGGTGTSYALCIYDGTGGFAGGVVIDRAGEMCGTAPCWNPIGKAPNDPNGPGKGYKYSDKALASDGVLKLVSKSGAAGKTAASVGGKGSGLPDGIPAALQASSQVTIQLRSSDGICLTADLTDITKQEAGFFKAK